MRRLWILVFISFLAFGAWGQPHFLTGTVQLQEGPFPETECLYLTIDVGAETYIITPDSVDSYDAETGRWMVILDMAFHSAGDGIILEAVDSCLLEDGTLYGVLSDSFFTDVGLLTLSEIEGLRPYLYDEFVTPTSGYIEDIFHFEVTYESDPWDRAPTLFELYIDDEVAANPSAVEPGDTDYTDGAQFFSEILGETIERGAHTFSFYVEDEWGLPAWTDTLEFTILNHYPELDYASLSVDPEPPTEISVITCIPGASFDFEGDDITFEFDWYVNSISVGVTGSTLDGEYFNKHDEVYCVVTPFDGTDYGYPATTEAVVILNTVPGIPEISINPASPFDFEDVEAVIDVDSYDPDEDDIYYYYEWVKDELTESTASILDNVFTLTGESWLLRVTPYDGDEYGSLTELPFTIGGPVLSGGYIDPVSGHPSSTIFTYYVTYSNSRNYPPGYILVDIDGVDYSMIPYDLMDEDYVDGAIYYYSTTLDWDDHQFRFSAMDDHGDVAIGMGDYILGPSMTNTPPVIDEVSISPTGTATELDIITAGVVVYHDDDDDDVTFEYQWYIDDELVPGAESSEIDGSYFDKGDRVFCEITPSDIYDSGSPVYTETVDIVNASPTADGVDILVSPEGEPVEGSILTASVSGADDPDGDDLIISYEWFVNGNPLGLDPSTDEIDGEYFDRGEGVFVQATVSDGEDDIVLTSPIITIGNTLPELIELAIVPDMPYTDDDLTVTLDYDDVDGDEVYVTYIWSCNGEFAGNDDNITSDMTAHFDIWLLEIQLADGFVEGEYVSFFDSVEILNTLPEAEALEDTITVFGTEYAAYLSCFDIDEDELEYEIIDGPDDMLILDDGMILWDVPDGDELTAYDIIIEIDDGYDAVLYEYTLWVYPITHDIFAPSNLEATGGYVGMIPLIWDAPVAFSELTSMPVVFVGYEVWRATDPDPETGDWALIGEPFVPSYVDLYVDAYVVYYYYVVAVYEIGVSAPSNEDYAFSIEGDVVDWYSRFSFGAVPMIDGAIDIGEWTDAMTYDFMSGEDVFKVYFKHTAGYLYIALENISDGILSVNDMFMVSIEDNHNDRWPSSSFSNEGEYRVKATGLGSQATFQGIWGLFPDGITRDVRGPAEGLLGGASSDAGYVTYELAIPIGDYNADLNIEELGTWIGIRLAVYNVDGYSWQLILPASSDPENPESFGALFLEMGAEAGRLCMEPTEFHMTLREGGIGSLPLEICNCGEGGYLSFSIHEMCSPAPFGGGELMRTTASNIAAYLDDESLVPQALSALGYVADEYDDAAEFASAVSTGGYELIIVSSENIGADGIWTAVQSAFDAGAKILIQSPDIDAADIDVLENIGLGLGEDLGDRGCALTWDIPEHPFFNVPMDVPASIERIEGDFDDYGDNLIAGEYSVLASFDLYPYPHNAAIIHNTELGIVVNSVLFSDLNDTDDDDIIDGVELLINEIWALLPCEDVSWLSENPIANVLAVDDCEDVAIIFDATDLVAGEYYAYITVETNDPTTPMTLLPCRLTVTEPEERWLELSFPDETVYGCPSDEVIVALSVGDLETMDITMLELTVSVDPDVAQPIDVDVMMGELGTMTPGPGTLTFSVESEDPLDGDGVLAMVHFTVGDVAVGSVANLGITGISYNPEAYVTDVYTYPGMLMVTSCVDEWTLTLDFQVSPELTDEVVVGVNPDATDAFDDGLDEENVPPEDWFDVWSDISSFDPDHPALSVDMRDADDDEIHWYIETGDSAGKLEWIFDDAIDVNGLGSIFLYCADDIVDMKSISIYFYDAGEDIEIIYRLTGEQPFVFNFEAGYSMFSLPLMLSEALVDNLFPGNLGCWYFNVDLQTWSPASVLAPGVGYVILFIEDLQFEFWGVPIEELDLNLSAGWNLIGTVMGDVDFTDPDDDPDGSILGSPYYAWYYDNALGTYVSTANLASGEGYFVAALNPCALGLPGSAALGKAETRRNPVWNGKIVVSDEALEIGVGEWRINPMPPSIPGGSESMAFLKTADWRMNGLITPDAEWTLVLTQKATVRFELPEGVDIDIDGCHAEREMSLAAGTYKLTTKAIPTEFALRQNVPNPFNAATSIEFALPAESNVTIAVFDVSGHVVRNVVNGKLSAGYHRYIWHGDDNSGGTVGSGLYFCRMKAGDFSAVRRMVIVK